jgi:hypothetical protein
MERDDFGNRRGIDEIKDDSPKASVIGIGIPALVIVAAAAAYFLWPATDAQVNQAETTPPPATTQPAPKANPDPVKTTPQAEQKEPPAAETKPNEMRDPRTDSQNAN